jgi:transcriptional regulator with PAS, ATPase and Fis domain
MEAPAARVPYLEAWDRVFLGWAYRLLGNPHDAVTCLENAAQFFSRIKVPAGEIRATLELAMLDAERGDLKAARQRIRALKASYVCGKGPLLNPMLSARLPAYEASIVLQSDPGALAEATGLVVESESYLVGQRVQDLEPLIEDLRNRISSRPALEEQLDRTRWASGQGPSARPKPLSADAIVGNSLAIRNVLALVKKAALLKISVLITGETGTGKELIARAVHGESLRRLEPLLSVNCAAVPEPLLEAELFGYARGAFSGADRDHPGLLRASDGGSFLFDEVGELPLAFQAKLLRVLDSGRVRPLGGTEESETDIRFLFTTSKDLQKLVEERRFRHDLFYRLGACELSVPSLRERLEDLPELVEHFRKLSPGAAGASQFTDGAIEALLSYHWPGNVRELENVVRRLVLTSTGPITREEVERLLGPPVGKSLFSPALLRASSLTDLQDHLEREYLHRLYADRGGDLKAMAKVLGIKLRALYDRFKRLGIRPKDLEWLR